MGTEEETGWGGACRGRARGAGWRWGRDAEEQGSDETLQEEERERTVNLGFRLHLEFGENLQKRAEIVEKNLHGTTLVTSRRFLIFGGTVPLNI